MGRLTGPSAPRPSTRLVAAGVALGALLLAGACGGGDDDGGDVRAAGDGGGASTTTTTTTKPGSTGASESDPWRVTAVPKRSRVGERFTLECPPGGKAGSLWGVETYTADSSICTAAVHVGLITFEEGGEVEYEIAPGLDEYDSASANEVLSTRYGRFDGSFIFPEAPPGSGEFTLGAETWQRNASEYRGRNGEEFTFECAPGGTAGSLWGTGTYTDDSSVCTAAVHAGVITLAKGGKVTIEIAPGRATYEGSAANGVTSNDYASYAGSFSFPDDQPTG